ncbi:MAG: hypothetical protein VYC97_04160, partial [SAR324 cluster bacterium]|nr:hypothetical protein [SAR324 cluster bacterium]
LNITHRVFFAGHFIKPHFLNVSDLADYAHAFHIARVLNLEELFVKREADVVKFLHSFHKTPYRLGRIEESSNKKLVKR